MVHATASVEDLKSGHLPSVCAKTGEPATGFSTVRISHLPGWTWILLLFGIWPFLIAWFFATRRIDASIPLSDLALRRVRAYTLTYAVLGTLALALVFIGLFGEHPSLVWTGIITLLVTLLFIAVGWLFVYPTGRFLDEDWISLSFVDERFATALNRWYSESNVEAGQGRRPDDGGTNWKVVLLAFVVGVAVLYFLSLAYCSSPSG